MKNIFNLFKKKKAIEENLYLGIFELKGHYVQIEELASNQFKYEVYSNGIDDKRLITGYTNNAGTAYSEANNFVQRIENIEPIKLLIRTIEGYEYPFIINRDDALKITETYSSPDYKAIDFYDYEEDYYYVMDREVIRDMSLDGYYE